jgi:hypothetical protein
MALSNPAFEPLNTPTEPVISQASASPVLEDQLAQIISTARNVAVIAEELLRDVSQTREGTQASPHTISMVPRLLTATEQQLASIAAMLRQG